ncbi:MAG TPA: helical backbone metal receptor [Acidimicrobiales bacterium]|nr:helical backbone metal receptor [Acidimicrobiales bacterium]
MSAARVVSLVPSWSETLSDWGVTPIACTRFCERPDLLHVGGTKDPDLAAITALAPRLVVMDEEENRREDFDALVARGLDVVATRVRDLADVTPVLTHLAQRLGVDFAPPRYAPAQPVWLRAFVPIWRRPWMALGRPTYGTSLLAHLGVEVVGPKGPYTETSLEEAAAFGADVVLAPSEPYPFSTRQRSELEQVAPAIFLEGRDLFWWGTRTPAALERLGNVLRERAER